MAESSKVRDEEIISTSNDTATTPVSCPTPPGNSNDESSPSMAAPAEPEMIVPETSEVVLQRLARQVEYYFSTANLSRDTYVSTLRSLNDGYVPVSIIANFGKVKSLVPYDALNAVRQAATDCSDLLEVVYINTETGKRVPVDENDEDSTLNTLEAVGPISGEPIPLSQVSNVIPVSPPAIKAVHSIQNTVILRDVSESTEESHIRELFTFEKCPSIQSLHLDVANCWFVTFDTKSRDDMVNVMFELMAKKFASGEPVKARLKSGVVMSSDNTDPNSMMYAPQPSSSPTRYYNNNNGGRKNKKKKNSNSSPNSKTTGNANQNMKTVKGKNNGNRRNNGQKQKKNNEEDPQQPQQQEGRSIQNVLKQKAPSLQTSSATMGEEQFPALQDPLSNSNKIEVEKVPDSRPEDDFSYDELENNRGGSDSASTATTSSSSSSSKQTSQQIGGYAAALLKSAPPKPQPTERDVKAEVKKNEKKGSNKATEPKKNSAASSRPKQEKKETAAPAAVSVKPPSWGGGKSFADILRKETASVVAAASEQ